jgi:predicted DNA-binding transcriptional regulator AlpA
MQKKQVNGELIPISEAAVILGVSKPTFYKRFCKGEYEAISIEKYRAGWMADMIDVFHYAYPDMSKDTLALLIYRYRADRIVRRGRPNTEAEYASI